LPIHNETKGDERIDSFVGAAMGIYLGKNGLMLVIYDNEFKNISSNVN
jgi:hypothetical protein